MRTQAYQLNRALSVKVSTDGRTIHIGSLPPVSRIVRDAPSYLADLIGLFEIPRTPEDALQELLRVHSNVAIEETAGAMLDLVSLGVLIPVVDACPRHDRHHLYFSLFGISADTYDRALGKATIGIVGAGGLGSSVAMLLAAAGVHQFVISDGDRLEPSNLTRSVLYREADLGKLKVERAAAQLRAINKRVAVQAVVSGFSGPEMIHSHFANCDVLVLTADRPSDVHRWMDGAAHALGIPYLTAGYIETHAAVGPFVDPGRSACYNCYTLGRPSHQMIELNPGLQAASYGPLNTISASVAADEVIRHLLGLPLRTRNCWVLIDSATLKPDFVDVPPHANCDCGAAAASIAKNLDLLAEIHIRERETTSLNRMLLDDLILQLALQAGRRVLDLGCGIGTMARALAAQGRYVTAVEKSPTMLREFAARTGPTLRERIRCIEGDVETVDWGEGPFDLIMVVLVLDHIQSPGALLKRCREVLAPDGRLLLVATHPFKDSGIWQDGGNGIEHWVLRDYFAEGLQRKSRFTQSGECTLSNFETQKWTLSGLSSLLTAAGLAIESIEEPRPNAAEATGSQQLRRASAIPYFLLLDCVAAR